MKRFTPIADSRMFGYEALRDDGIVVQVVEVQSVHPGWNIFLVRDGEVVAESVDQRRICGGGYLSRTRAFRLAERLLS